MGKNAGQRTLVMAKWNALLGGGGRVKGNFETMATAALACHQVKFIDFINIGTQTHHSYNRAASLGTRPTYHWANIECAHKSMSMNGMVAAHNV